MISISFSLFQHSSSSNAYLVVKVRNGLKFSEINGSHWKRVISVPLKLRNAVIFASIQGDGLKVEY